MSLLERQLPALAALLSALVYAATLAPTISHTDSGELAAVCNSFGVAHPTGYPLFTLLGGLFARLPFGSVAFKLNLMGLLLTAGGVYWWGRALDAFLAGWVTKTKDESAEMRVRMARLFAILSGSLFLAFGRTWWMQSSSAEVYALHCFLMCLNIFLLVRAWEAPAGTRKAWLFVGIGLALSFANHLSTFVILPGIAWLFFRKEGFNAPAFKLIGVMLAVFIPLLLLLYSWLPIRAGMDPQFAWGNPVGSEEIWHHVSGKQFSVWMFTGMEAFKKNFGAFFTRTPWEFGIGLLLLLPGIAYSFQYKRDWAVFFGLGFLTNLVWACNYAIKDLEPYFLLSLVSLSFFIAVGMRWVWLRLNAGPAIRLAATGLAGAGLLAGIVFNYSKVDQRNAWQYHDYAKATLESVPPNSLVISGAWDILVSPSYYLQSVEGVRPDVGIIDYHMLHDRHWYADHLRRNVPELAQDLGPKLDAWERTVRDFDLRGIMDVGRLSADFTAVFQGILQQMTKRPVYFSSDVVHLINNPANGLATPPNTTMLPEQYLYRLVTADESRQYRPSKPEIFPLRYHRGFGEPEDETLIRQLEDVISTRIRYEQAFKQAEPLAKLQAILGGLPRIEAPARR